MQKILCTVFVWMSIFLAQLSAHEYCSAENITKPSIDTSQEFTCCISPKDLLVDHEKILVNLDGILFAVKALEIRENQWMAKIDFGRDAGYCPRGHDLCRYCGLCHLSGCWYYVIPCWKK